MRNNDTMSKSNETFMLRLNRECYEKSSREAELRSQCSKQFEKDWLSSGYKPMRYDFDNTEKYPIR